MAYGSDSEEKTVFVEGGAISGGGLCGVVDVSVVKLSLLEGVSSPSELSFAQVGSCRIFMGLGLVDLFSIVDGVPVRRERGFGWLVSLSRIE